jgi:mRNA interferase RelE/StbE
MWKVVYQPAAAKMLRRLDDKTADRIIAKMSDLARDPHAPNSNAKKLRGEDGYRLRVGDWRVIYTLDHGVLTVVVVRIGPRGSVYE